MSSVASTGSVGLEGWAGGGMLAVRAADVVWPGRRGPHAGARGAFVVAGNGKPIRSGELVVFFKPVVVTVARVRRDGRVQAGGHPADHARLGIAEAALDELTGTPGTIDRLAGTVTLNGKVTGEATRALTTGAALRAVLLATLMPESSGGEVLGALFGELAAVPWARRFAVPTGTVLSTWRAAVGPGPVEQLRDQLLAAVAAAHERHDEWRAVQVGGLELCAGDGTVTRMPDTPANRARFGAATDPAPYPQVRDLLLTDAATRATLGVVSGPSGGDKADAEQALLDRALAECPWVFTPHRLLVLDRNFPGLDRLRRLIRVTHVLVRLKSNITVTRVGKRLADGSFLADVGTGRDRLRMRIIEYHVQVDGRTTPELFCLATDLDDHATWPAGMLAGAYRWRWDGAETTLRENKSTLHGAGPSTGPIFRSATPDLIRQEHAAWIITTSLVRAVLRTAAATARPAGKGRRAAAPVHVRELSFTAARRAAVTTTRTGTATASLPTGFVQARHQQVLTDLGRRRHTIDRDRHRDHKTKARQPFPAADPKITTRTAPAQVLLAA